MAIAQFSVASLGTTGISLSVYLAKIHNALAQSHLNCQLTPRGTVLEGPLEDILTTVAKGHETPFTQDAQRVMTLLNIDDCRNKPATAQNKVDSVVAKRST
jgi:uncharacterized protein (TIGR00106 family)